MSDLIEKRYGVSGDVIVLMLFVSVILLVFMGIRLESNRKEFEVVTAKEMGNRELFMEKIGWLESQVIDLKKYHQ